MFKIGEFSKLTQVSIRMLRYYDEEGLLKPAHVDMWTGHRLYSTNQIPRLNKIIYLRDSGLNVSEIKEALDINDNDLLATLERKQVEIEKAIQSERDKLNRIQIARNEILNNKEDMRYSISTKSVPSYQVLSYRKTMPSYYSEGEMWQELCEYANKEKLSIDAKGFSLYHDEDYRDEDVDIEICIPIKKIKVVKAPFSIRTVEAVEHMASTFVYGDFSKINDAFLSFAKWLEENSNFSMASPTRQIVHKGPEEEDNPDNYLIEIQIPLVSHTV